MGLEKYQTQVQQFEIQKKNLDALKDTVGSLGYIKSSNNIYNAKAGLTEIQNILGDVGNLSATSKASDFKAKADRLNSLYTSQLNDSNARIRGNLDVINTLKTKLAQSDGANVNTSASAKLNAAIQDAYQQIEMEKTLQAGLSKSMKNGLGLIGKKYSTAKWVENSNRKIAWN